MFYLYYLGGVVDLEVKNPESEYADWQAPQTGTGRNGEKNPNSAMEQEKSDPSSESQKNYEREVIDWLIDCQQQINHESKPDVKRALQKETADMLAKIIRQIPSNNLPDFINRFNESVDENLKGTEFSLLDSENENVVIVNENGRLEQLSINRENAQDTLAKVKEKDAELHGNSYELRKKILEASGGKIKTCDAYTYGSIAGLSGSELKKYLDDPESWLVERQKIQDEIIESELKKAQALSGRLEDDQPTIYALRGNTAAGKTSRLREHPTFSRALDEQGQPSGAINPDTYKESLKEKEKSYGKQRISHFQAHAEGSMITRKIKSRIQESESSMIIDQRLNEQTDIIDLINTAEAGDKRLRLLDVDTPFEVSLIRVLDRKPGGADPLPPFAAVAEGYDGVRKNRLPLINQVRQNPKIDQYVLYVSDEQSQSQKVAEKINGQLEIIKGQEEAFLKATSRRTKAEIDKLRTQIIDDDYIEQAKLKFNLTESQIAALEQCRGKTYEEALNEHATKIDIEPPAEEDYLTQAQRNLEITSRTAQGTVDTSASVDKAQKMAEDLTAEKAAILATENFKNAIQQLYEKRDIKIRTAEEIKALVEQIATQINAGITKEGVLIRSGADSEKYPYTSVANLEEAMQQFYQEFTDRLNDPDQDPIELAAWVEYRIDLTDHLFADGCGKTAKAISSWVLMRGGKRLPQYSSRDDYYAHAPKLSRDLHPEAEAEQMEKWINYYQSICQ